MAGSVYNSLAELKSSMQMFREHVEGPGRGDMISAGALEPLITAVIKLVDEIERRDARPSP